MAIDAKQVTIDELFGSKQYFVDFYQREYKWNDNIKNQTYKPIKSLLDDIFYRFYLYYEETSDITAEAVSKYGWYYLNSFMTNTVDGNTYIVDGQQRLTTLTVLTISLLKIGGELGINEGKITYLKNKICSHHISGNMVFWMGFTDRVNALKAIYDLQSNENIVIPQSASIAEKNIYEAYKTIYAYLKSHLNEQHIFDAFMLYLYQRVYLIAIDVNDSSDVAMAFEVINDRGIPLKAYEILKGKILGIIDKIEVSEYVDKWESSIKKITDNRGDYVVDEFLSTYFQSKYADTAQQYRELQKDRYHKAIYFDDFNDKIGFRSATKDKTFIPKIKNFVADELPFFSNIYLKLLNNEDSPHVWFNNINEQDSQFYLLMSAVNLNDPQFEEKYLLVARQFDRLYVLSNLMGAYRSNVFSADLIGLGISIRGKSCDEIKKVFSETLIKIINKNHNRIDIIDPFKYELFANVGYSSLGSRFLRYFFARIDHFIAEETSLNTGTYYSLISQAKGKDAHHIEHILAHDADRHNVGLFIDEDQFNEERNRLGGLVLLKGKVNQSSGNELYSGKLKTYACIGTLFAQTLCPDFNHSNVGFKIFCQKHHLVFNTYSEYDKTAIDERQRLLFEIIKIIWA